MYATFAEFVEVYPDACAEVDYPPSASAASDIIDIITNFRIQEIGFNNLPEQIKNRIKRAAIAQTEYILQNGGPESILNGSVNNGFTVGSVSISGGNTDAASLGDDIGAAPMAVQWLASTGLLYRGVGTC